MHMLLIKPTVATDYPSFPILSSPQTTTFGAESTTLFRANDVRVRYLSTQRT